MATTALHRKQFNNPLSNQKEPVNLEWPERYVSIVWGAKMALSGITKIFKHPVRSTVRIFAGGYLLNRGITGHCELYTKIGKTSIEPVNVNIRYTFNVAKHRQEVYDFWRKLENLPLFMSHLDNITAIDNKRSHWEAKVPGNIGNISWDAEIIEDEPGKHIAWQSLPGSTIDNAGKVDFEDAPGSEGTIVKVVITYLPPAGGFGAGLAKLLNPLFERIVREDVLSFKEYIEKVPTTTAPVHHIETADSTAPAPAPDRIDGNETVGM
jgi:uncharacterized membrane protein